MGVKLTMYEGSWAHIRERTQELGLDLDVVTFDRDGLFGPEKRPASEVEVDYMWLSLHLARDGVRKAAFDAALSMKRLDLLQTFNAGLDDPVYRQLADRGVRICNSSAQGFAIAEYVIAQVMAVLHPFERQREMQAAREWGTTPFREISRQTWAIVGFGPIGEAVAHREKEFGANVLAMRRSPAPHADVDEMGTLADLSEMASRADVVLLACPLTAETRGVAGPAFFGAVKEGAILVNIARGGVVDDAALIAALDAGRIETAILDVFDQEPLPNDHPFWAHPGVRMTPHTSFAGDGGPDRWDRLFLDNIRAYATGGPLIREVDPADI